MKHICFVIAVLLLVAAFVLAASTSVAYDGATRVALGLSCIASLIVEWMFSIIATEMK